MCVCVCVCVCVNDRDRIGLAVLRMLEKGELQKLHNTWWYGKGECVADDSKVMGPTNHIPQDHLMNE